MSIKTVICIDNSGSTSNNHHYFKTVDELLERELNPIVITWNTKASIVDPATKHFTSTGGTNPSCFLGVIRNFDHDYKLIITTDGEIYDNELSVCKEIIDSSNILTKITSFEIYFIGQENRMNLRMNSLFNTVRGEKKIFINQTDSIQVRDIDLGLIEKLTYQDFANERSVIASVLSMIQTYPDKKSEIRSQICKLSNRIIANDLIEASIRAFHDNNDVDGCISYVKKLDNTKKKAFQQTINKLLNLFDAKDIYSLSHLLHTSQLKEEDIDVEEGVDDDDEDDEDSEDSLICDILYKKIEYLCIPVKMIADDDSNNEDKFALLPDKFSKKYSSNPFMILKDEGVIQRIVKRVEPQKLDLVSYNKLKRHDGRVQSPFSRDDLKGVFIFHSDEDDVSNYSKILRNNNRTLSFIFGENNKLPGNKALWNVLFLYILIKHHAAWKQHEAKLKEEILFVCRNARSFITFSPLLNPTIVENLDVCLWYIVKVAHRAFENAHSNVLRSIEGAEDLLEFYSYVFHDDQLAHVRAQLKKWNLWKYFVRNRSDWKLKLDVISHYQNFEDMNGSKVFFSVKSNTNLFGMDPNEITRLYTLLKQSPNPTLMDNLNTPIEARYYERVEHVDDEIEDLSHVFICTSTCNPLVICPITKLHWKRCLEDIVEDINLEKSYLRLFKRFCVKYQKYPKNEDDLLVFHSDTYNRNHEGIIVYPMNTKESLRLVMDKFVDVMKEHDVEEYLKLSMEYSNETRRLQMEERCSTCTFHGRET